MSKIHRSVVLCLSFLALAACDRPTPPTDVRGFDERTAARLFEKMDRIATAMEAAGASRAEVTATPAMASERVLVADTRDELVARIEALELAITTLDGKVGRAMAPPRRAAVVPPARASAVSHLAEMLDSEDAAQKQEGYRSVFRLTENQVLERYGSPSTSYIDQTGNVVWQFDSAGRRFTLTFVGGVVAATY